VDPNQRKVDEHWNKEKQQNEIQTNWNDEDPKQKVVGKTWGMYNNNRTRCTPTRTCTTKTDRGLDQLERGRYKTENGRQELGSVQQQQKEVNTNQNVYTKVRTRFTPIGRSNCKNRMNCSRLGGCITKAARGSEQLE